MHKNVVNGIFSSMFKILKYWEYLNMYIYRGKRLTKLCHTQMIESRIPTKRTEDEYYLHRILTKTYKYTIINNSQMFVVLKIFK